MHTRAAFQPCKIDRRAAAVRPRRPARSPAPAVATFAASLSVGASVVAVAGPTGGTVVQGQGTISMPGTGQTVINQSSQQLMLNWNTFNVGANEGVRFNQPSASAVAFNHILDQNPSQIFGTLSANGKVVLINPNGLLIGRTATLNVNSLVVSSLDAIDFDPTSGRYRFSATHADPGAVVNEGAITAGRGGSVTLLGGSVSNSGTIVADYGTVNLAAGRIATLDLAGDGMLRLEVGSDLTGNPGSVVSAVENSGSVQANGGQVLLTASAVKNVFENLVNNTGVVRANRIDNTGGTIELLGPGGTVESGGTLDASAGDAVSTGGAVRVLGDRVRLTGNAVVDVSGAAGGGAALIGGDEHGANPDVLDASNTSVSSGATINADAGAQGNGGRIVVWSNDFTDYGGSLSARGGSLSGDAGSAEVSGKQTLSFHGASDLTAAHGARGTLLLDPSDIQIDGSTNGGGNPTITVSGGTPATTTIGTQDIAALLQTNNVALTADGAINEVSGAGAINVTGNNNLTMSAGLGMTILNSISVGGRLSLSTAAGTFQQSSGTLLSSGTEVDVTASQGAVALGSIAAPTVSVTSLGSIQQSSGDLIKADTLTFAPGGGGLGTGASTAINIQEDTVGQRVTLEVDNATNAYLQSSSGVNVQSITASNLLSLTTTGAAGSIELAPGGTGINVPGSVVLSASGNIGSLQSGQVAGFNSVNSSALPVSSSAIQATSTKNAGIINLQLGATAFNVSARLSPSSGTTSGAIMLQSTGDLDMSGAGGTKSVTIGANSTAQVGLAANGILKLSATNPVADHTPSTLLLSGADVVTDSLTVPRSFGFNEGRVIFGATNPGTTPAGDYTFSLSGVSDFAANIGGTTGLVVTQSSSTALNLNGMSVGGDLSVTNAGSLTVTAPVNGNGVSLVTNAANSPITLDGVGAVGGAGDPVTLKTSGASSGITVGAQVSTSGAGNVTVETDGATSGIALNAPVATTGTGTITVLASDQNSGVTLGSTISGVGAVSVSSGSGSNGGALSVTNASGTDITSSGGSGGVTVFGTTVGTSTGHLTVATPMLKATATSGGIFIDNSASGTLIVQSLSGDGVTLSNTSTASGSGMNITGAVTGGAGAVSLSASGPSSSIAVASTGSVSSTGGITLQDLGQNGDISLAGSVTSSGAVFFNASRAITAAGVTGSTVTMNTMLSGAGVGVTVNGAVVGNAVTGTTVSIDTNGSLNTGSGGSIGGTKVSLTAGSIGTSASSPVFTSTPTLAAQSNSGNIYLEQVQAGGDLNLQAGTPGFLHVVTDDGTLTTNGVSGNGVMLSAGGTNKNLVLTGSVSSSTGSLDLRDTGAGGNIDINTAISGPAGVSLTATAGGNGGAINMAAAVGSNNTVSMKADGAITDTTGSSVIAPTLIAQGASIGTGAQPLFTTAQSISLQGGSGGIYLTSQGGTTGLSANSAGPVTLATTFGPLVLDGVTGTIVNLTAPGSAVTTPNSNLVAGSTSVTVTGASIAIGTDTPLLTATSTGGGISIQQATDSLRVTASATGGAVQVTTTSGATLTVAGASGAGINLTSTGADLTVDGSINAGSSAVNLDATGAGNVLAGTNNPGNPITGGSLTVTGASIGAAGTPLVTNVPGITSNSTGGGTSISQLSGPLSLAATVTGGALDVETQSGSLTESSLTGSGISGITLVAGGAGNTLTVNGMPNVGANGVTLEATGAAGSVVLNNSVTTSGDVTVTAGTSTAGGTITEGSGAGLTGNNITVAAASIGTSASKLRTAAATSLTANSSSGDIWITQTGSASLSAAAVGGGVNVTDASGTLTAAAVSGNSVALQSNNNIAVNGVISGPTVILDAPTGVITAGSGNQINATSLNAIATAIGAPGSGTLKTNVASLIANASNGGIYVQDNGDLNLNATATGGPVDAAAVGVLQVTNATGNGLNLSTAAAGQNFSLTGALNGGAGPVTLTASGAGSFITLAGALNAASDVTFNAAAGVSVNAGITTAGGVTLTTSEPSAAVNVNSAVTAGAAVTLNATGAGGIVNLNAPISAATVALSAGTVGAPGSVVAGTNEQITASSLTVNGGLIGTNTAPLLTTVGSLHVTDPNGVLYVANAGDLALTASATGGSINVASSGALNAASVSATDVTLSATGTIGESAGGSIAGTTVSLKGAAIGASTAALNTDATTLDATSTNGAIYLAQSGPLSLTASATGGAVNAQVNGVLTVNSVSGSGVALAATGTGGVMNVDGLVAGGSAPVSLVSSGAINAGTGEQITGPALTVTGATIGSSGAPLATSVAAINATSNNGAIFIAQSGTSAELNASATGGVLDVTSTGGALDIVSVSGPQVILTTSGALTAEAGSTVTGNQVTLSGLSIGTGAAPVITNTPVLIATSSNGGIYVDQAGALTVTAQAAGGPLDVHTGGALTVNSSSGVGASLTTTSAGSGIAVSGLLNGGSGAVTLTSAGAISGATGEQITAASLTANGTTIGTSAAPFNAEVVTLTTTSTNGGTYINQTGPVTITASATGGAIDVQSAGALTVDGATGAGITLASSGTGNGIAVQGAINAGTNDVTLNAASGAITASGADLVTGGTLTATATSIGSSGSPLNIAVSNLVATASSGDVDVSQQASLELQSVQAGGNIAVTDSSGNLTVGTVKASGNVGLTASAGTITDADSTSLISGDTLTLTAQSIGAPSTLTGQTLDATTRVNTNGPNLVATSTAGGVYINQKNGLSSVTVHAGGGSKGNIELLTATGDINIQSITASGTLLLAAGGNIYDLSNASPITAQAAELRAGGTDPNGGHIGSLSHPLVLELNPGDTLRMFVPQTINANSASSGPATLPSPGVQSTLSTFIAPSLLAVGDGFGQFQGIGETQFTSQAELLVRSIQNQTATVQTVVGLDWASFDPNVSLFGKLDPSVCLPGDQRDEEAGAPGAADKCVAK